MQPRGRLRTDEQAVRFVEVVVNGPKSWSLAAALHPDIAAAYDAAQDRAAEQIIGWLAEHATTRVGPRGRAGAGAGGADRGGDGAALHLPRRRPAPASAPAGQRPGVRRREMAGPAHGRGPRLLDAINGIGHAAVDLRPGVPGRAGRARLHPRPGDGEIRAAGAVSSGRSVPGRRRSAATSTGTRREWRAAHPGRAAGAGAAAGVGRAGVGRGPPGQGHPAPGRRAWTARWLAELAAPRLPRPATGPVAADAPTPVGALDRDAAVERVLARLAARRSAWNAADIRGEVEQLIAAAGIVADAGGARSSWPRTSPPAPSTACVPLLDRGGRARAHPGPDLAAGARRRGRPRRPARRPRRANRRRPTGRDRRRTAVRSAARRGQRGRGRRPGRRPARWWWSRARPAPARPPRWPPPAPLLERQGHRLVVVTPTLKAAQVAAGEVGAAAGSAAWLVHQHGWRWDDDGALDPPRAGEPTRPPARLRRPGRGAAAAG